MSLLAQGISGHSGSGGSGNLSSYSYVAAPGAVYELSRWTGYTLRHLSYSYVNGVAVYPLGGLFITNRLPQSLRPQNMDPGALWAVFVPPHDLGRVLQFSFEPGLIWVAPGETLYIVVCDLMTHAASSENAARWTLNILWEPYGR